MLRPRTPRLRVPRAEIPALPVVRSADLPLADLYGRIEDLEREVRTMRQELERVTGRKVPEDLPF